MSLKDFWEKRKGERRQHQEEMLARKIEDRKNGVKLPEKIKRHLKEMSVNKRITAGIIVAIIVIGAIFSGYLFITKRTGEDAGRNGMNPSDMAMGDSITASGTTTVGMVEETFDVDDLETTLEIEEVYLNNGDEVEENTAILKVSDESLESAKKELENAAASAEYAYRLGLVDYDEALISAKSTYDQALINANYAGADYDNEIQEKAEEVADLEKQVEDAQELVDEYTASVENDYYYTYYNIAELESELYENFTLLMKLYDDWNIDGQNSNETDSSKKSLYEDFSKEVDEEQTEYDEALEKYEDAARVAESGLTKAKADLEKLQAKLTKAKVEYDEAVQTANSTKTETEAQSTIAEDTYNTAVEKAEEELAVLKDEMDDADENLTAFNDSISDGYMYTSTAGTVMMVDVSEGGTLDADSMVMAYTDESTISVSASVSQDDIAELTVGQEATVVFEDYGTYTGHITSINPNTDSSSRSSVAYTVAVLLDGDISQLSQNLSATVMFESEG